MRLCWSTADYEAGGACSPELARAFADAGVVGVTVHGRTTEMKFSGVVQLAGIARVVEAVNGRIPVIGNGDVREPEDAAKMIRETGCDGVMIGRGALSTPWIFRDTAEFLRSGRTPQAPSEEEIIAMIRRYFELMRVQRDDKYALMQINRRVTWFAKRLGNLPDGTRVGVKPFKEAVRVARTTEEVHAALDLYLAGGLRGGLQTHEDLAV